MDDSIKRFFDRDIGEWLILVSNVNISLRILDYHHQLLTKTQQTTWNHYFFDHSELPEGKKMHFHVLVEPPQDSSLRVHIRNGFFHLCPAFLSGWFEPAEKEPVLLGGMY